MEIPINYLMFCGSRFLPQDKWSQNYVTVDTFPKALVLTLTEFRKKIKFRRNPHNINETVNR